MLQKSSFLLAPFRFSAVGMHYSRWRMSLLLIFHYYAGFKQQYAEFAAKKNAERAEKEPVEAKVLGSILKSSATPYRCITSTIVLTTLRSTRLWEDPQKLDFCVRWHSLLLAKDSELKIWSAPKYRGMTKMHKIFAWEHATLIIDSNTRKISSPVSRTNWLDTGFEETCLRKLLCTLIPEIDISATFTQSQRFNKPVRKLM